MQAAIEARAVSHRTRAGQVTVRDVSLTVGHGELVAIIGGGGSGKTTLLDAMSGLRPPTSGIVVHHVKGGAGGTARPAGYVAPGATMHTALPLGAALGYTAALRSVHGRDAVAEALRVAGLASKAPVRVGALNPGERKRAAIAAELMSGPAQLFLDEPTAGLDPAQAAEVLRLLRRLCDGGVTVVLTTSSPLEADRCDKVAVLAAGGHLAFFGTPAAARGYFGADSLEEIYERLSGLADPTAAWSRRFFQLARSRAGLIPPTTPPVPGPAVLVPDVAGPHSAGRPGAVPVNGCPPGAGQADRDTAGFLATDPDDGPPVDPDASPATDSDDDPAPAPANFVPAARNGQAGAAPAGSADSLGPGGADRRRRTAGELGARRQLAVLVRREVDVLRRTRLAAPLLAGAPAAVLATFAVLISAGALDAPAASRAWAVIGGFVIGLAYGLPQVHAEFGVLRTERFAGLHAVSYVLAKLAILLPALAAADAVALLVPLAGARLPAGYGSGYLTLLLCSAVALGLALLLSAALPDPGTPAAAALCLPALLMAGAILTLLDRAVWPDWTVLAALAVCLLLAGTAWIARRAPRPAWPAKAVRYRRQRRRPISRPAARG